MVLPVAYWMNGSYVEQDELTISAYDHGFLYGVGFFETFRTYDGQVFLFQQHMERLRQALTEYNIHFPFTDEEIEDAVTVIYEREHQKDRYFRLNVSAGVHDLGLSPASYEEPNVILFQKELLLSPRGTEKEGVWLKTSRNLPESTIRHKSQNFANNVRGRLELASLREIEGLFTTPDGYVAEGITSNVFWVKEGILYTPSIETGILPGITRAFLIRLAGQLDLCVHEGLYRIEEVLGAEEVFVTNSIQELVPLAAIEGTEFLGKRGPVYQRLHEGYQEAIEQMKESDQ